MLAFGFLLGLLHRSRFGFDAIPLRGSGNPYRSLPMLSSWPSGSMTLVTRPTGWPVLDIPVIVTVTSSPALNDFAVMPKLISVEGAFHSPSQCTTLPLS